MRKINRLTSLLILSILIAASSARAEVEFKPVSVYWAHTAATANVATLSGLASTIGGLAVDTDGMIVLLTKQTDGKDNGAWVAHSGAWERMFPTAVNDSLFYVRKGTNKGICGGRDWRAIDLATGLEKESVWFCN